MSEEIDHFYFLLTKQGSRLNARIEELEEEVCSFRRAYITMIINIINININFNIIIIILFVSRPVSTRDS